MIIDKIQLAVESFQVDEKPHFSFGTWNDEANRLTQLNKITSKQGSKFPLVFLLLNFKEKIIKAERKKESDIKLFIVNRSDDKLTPQQRHVLELPELRQIESDLLKNLKSQGIQFEDYEREELFYPENKLNTPVNAIELSIPVNYCSY